MAKLFTLFVFLIVIQAVLLLYHDPTPQNTSIWAFVTDPHSWNSLDFFLTWAAIAGGVGLIGLAAGSIFGFKTDFIVLAPAIIGIASLGAVFLNLYNVVSDELIARVFTTCDPGSCAPVNLIMAITIGPLALYYVWTVIEWWRGKDY